MTTEACVLLEGELREGRALRTGPAAGKPETPFACNAETLVSVLPSLVKKILFSYLLERKSGRGAERENFKQTLR